MAEITLENVAKIYDGNVRAVSGVNLEIKDHEFMVLVGPSGCGKSTTLRMIAGLEDISEGTIKVAGRVVNDVQPKDRDLAMVFQNYALYPHMTVFDNMAFGLRLRHFSKEDIKARVNEAAAILGLEPYLERYPKALSGGQRQRVAVGRAIVRKPAAFLFDEPLSNLDAKMRVQMRTELSLLHKKLQTTMVYVTHDQVEAMTMGTRICVMRDGKIQQIDTPLAIYDTPANLFVAGFIGMPPMNFINGKLEKSANGVMFKNECFQFEFKDSKVQDKLNAQIGKDTVFGIRPEDIGSMAAFNQQNPAQLKGTLRIMEPMGAETYLHFETPNGDKLVAKVDPHFVAEAGQELSLPLQESKVHLFDLASTNIIL